MLLIFRVFFEGFNWVWRTSSQLSFYVLGSLVDERVGSTNLHLDVADAINIMAYCGAPNDCAQQTRQTILKVHSYF